MMAFMVILQVLSLFLFFMVVFCLYKDLTEKPKKMFVDVKPATIEIGNPIAGDGPVTIDTHQLWKLEPCKAGDLLMALGKPTGNKELDWFNLQFCINHKDHPKNTLVYGINYTTGEFIKDPEK